ncbi:uncharacterized protein LOC110690082 [Chenopodium quinoa]|uniref:uncharacterized protein LOC110690082 n=1 Tax=Chenopodium quinoa TaxID=63459 RepID=UPI000B779085|nr:uncharacterized protein LOC110690082 [Chenopodium quinoa]
MEIRCSIIHGRLSSATPQRAFTILDHIDPSIPKPINVSDELWDRLDVIILQWVYRTISTNLLYKILVDKATAMGTWLAAMDHPISEECLVLQLTRKLTLEYNMVATLIQQSVPLPSFDKACSMLELDRTSREKNQDTQDSYATVLLSTSVNSSSNSSQQQQHSQNPAGHGGSSANRGNNKKNNTKGVSRGAGGAGRGNSNKQQQQFQ